MKLFKHSFRNESGEKVPPFAVMVVTEIDLHDEHLVFVIGKPTTATLDKAMVINGSSSVENERHGECWSPDGLFAVATPDTTYTAGDLIGAKDGSWLAEPGEEHFEVVGRIGDKDLHLVRRLGGGSTLDLCHPFWGTIPTVTALETDLPLALRDGCLVAHEVTDCPDEDEPSGSESSSGSSSGSSSTSFSDSCISCSFSESESDSSGSVSASSEPP